MCFVEKGHNKHISKEIKESFTYGMSYAKNNNNNNMDKQTKKKLFLSRAV